jgi:hypothetical protein
MTGASTGEGTSVDVRPGVLAGRPAVRLVIRCAHGTSDWFVLRGADVRGNVAALEVATASHGSRLGCGCGGEPEVPPRPSRIPGAGP